MADHNLSDSFLIWRLPRATHFHFFTLTEGAVGNNKVCFAPFAGKPIFYNVASKKEVAIDALCNLDLQPNLEDISEESTQKPIHLKLLENAIKSLNSKELSKVVLSRKSIVYTQPKPQIWLQKLAELYPDACVFAFYTPKTGMWMGATPEMLLDVVDGQAVAHSLAGTRLAEENGAWGTKELEEQDIVTRHVREVFSAFKVANIETEGPITKNAGPVSHLFTRIKGCFPDSKNVFDLATRLHPTAAVGGLPKPKALRFIRERENIDRQFYTGFFGVASGRNARFYVNLRCMRVFADGVVLYAGGGITAASKPEEEWLETSRKLETLLRVINS